jgi:mannosyl-oligosaccharide alpha-1,2-mannosidase
VDIKDMVLVSVDDHVVEPPNLFEGRLPAKYQDLAWEAFGRITELCRAGSGFSGLQDVTLPDGGEHDDFQESFWLAETLKYLYLTFGPENAVQLQVEEPNGWVFNTEAHPVKVRGTS